MPAFQQPPSPISPGCGCKSNEHLRRQVGPLQRKCACCVRLTCSALRHHEPHVRGDKWTCLWRCCKEVALTRGGVFCSILIQVFRGDDPGWGRLLSQRAASASQFDCEVFKRIKCMTVWHVKGLSWGNRTSFLRSWSPVASTQPFYIKIDCITW